MRQRAASGLSLTLRDSMRSITADQGQRFAARGNNPGLAANQLAGGGLRTES
jgi:hypothetical protein